MRRGMDIKMLIMYFVIGGVVVSTVTYFGSHAKSQLAAFIAMLPAVTVVTLCTIYSANGAGAAVSYAKNLLIMLPSWVLYILGIIFLLPRIGLAGSLIASIAVFLGTALLILKLT